MPDRRLGSVVNPRVPGGGSGTEPRILYMENTSTAAEINTALADASYDGVSLQAGTYTIDVHLAVPDGKILQSAYWGSDIDSAAMAILDLDADVQIQLGASFIHHVKVEFDAASTVDAVTTTGDAIAEWVRVESSDGAWHGYWAFGTGFQRVLFCSIVGLNGVNVDGVASTGVTPESLVEVGYNYIDCVYTSGTNSAHGLDVNETGAYIHDNFIYRAGYGIYISSDADKAYFENLFIESCRSAAVHINTAPVNVTMRGLYASRCSIGQALAQFNLGQTSATNWIIDELYSYYADHTGFYIACDYASIGTLYDLYSDSIGIEIVGDHQIADALFAFGSNSDGIDLDACRESTIGLLACENCSGSVTIQSDSGVLSIGRIFTNSCGTITVAGDDITIGEIYVYDGDSDGIQIWVASQRIVIGTIHAYSCADAGLVLSDVEGINIGQVFAIDNVGNGVEIGPEQIIDCTLDFVHVTGNGGDGICELADGDALRCYIGSIFSYNNGALGVNLKSTSGRNWLRNIIAEGNTTAAQTSIASSWVSGTPYAEYYFSTPAATTVAVGGTFQKAAGNTTWTSGEDFSDDTGTDNRAKYDSGAYTNRTRSFLVTFTGDVEADVAELVQIAIYDSTPAQAAASVVGVDLQSANDRVPISCSAVVSLAHDAHIELFVTAATANTDVTVRGCLTALALEAVQ